jgi:autotransporter passenger strand-loop-strand repeat protein
MNGSRGSQTIPNTIAGLAAGDVIELAGVAFDPGGGAALQPDNALAAIDTTLSGGTQMVLASAVSTAIDDGGVQQVVPVASRAAPRCRTTASNMTPARPSAPSCRAAFRWCSAAPPVSSNRVIAPPHG